jgi:integrase
VAAKRGQNKHDADTIKYWSDAQLQAFFRACSKNKRDLALFRVMYHRGLRAGEVALLMLSDFGKDAHGEWSLRVTRKKGGEGGEFPLVAAELTPLRAWLRERGDVPGPLFMSRQGTGLSQPQIWRLVRRYCKAAGIPNDLAHPHALRHSCATSLLERNETLDYIRGHLGHQDPRTTLIYAKVTGRAKREAVRRLRDWK